MNVPELLLVLSFKEQPSHLSRNLALILLDGLVVLDLMLGRLNLNSPNFQPALSASLGLHDVSVEGVLVLAQVATVSIRENSSC